MLELALATLVLSAISDQEQASGRSGEGPITGSVPASSLDLHPMRSFRPEDHVPEIREERANVEIRRRQRLMLEHASQIEALRQTRTR